MFFEWFISDHKILDVPNYIKIDVDGIEHLILEGADRYLGDDKLKSLSITSSQSYTFYYRKYQLETVDFKSFRRRHTFINSMIL